jgi:benzodiazapine receptor
MKKKVNWKVLIDCLIIVFLIAFLGSMFTTSKTNSDWYQLNKPSITPPNFVFPVVWNILFFLISLSLYFAWTNSKNRKSKTKIVFAFGINLILNAFWSYLFFKLENPTYAFYELIILWFSILFMILTTYKINKKSSYLLIPYFIWVSFAGILNYLFAFA